MFLPPYFGIPAIRPRHTFRSISYGKSTLPGLFPMVSFMLTTNVIYVHIGHRAPPISRKASMVA